MRKALPLLLAAACLLPGCGFLVVRGARHVYGEMTKDDKAVDAALEAFAQRMLHKDFSAAAALFTADGTLQHDGQPPTVGPAAIQAYLQSFEGLSIQAYVLKPGSTSTSGDSASQRGSYSQTVQTVAGESLSAQGEFEADWQRQPGGRWLLRRLLTR